MNRNDKEQGLDNMYN
jgi:hypothetical protein